MENLGFELTNMESIAIIRSQVLERMATSNLKAIEGYIAHQPADEEAKAIQLNSTLILSKIKSGKKVIWSQAATGDLGLQVPTTQEVPPYEPSSIYVQTGIESFQHICAMDRYRDFSPEELRLNAYHLGRGLQICSDECFHHICAMDRYRDFSPEELRLNDYHQEQKLRSSSASRSQGGALTEVPVLEQLNDTAQASDVKK
ncbi:MAG: hypothetical protein L6R42_003139 [Xanthoria sp. 1 TBL-2021]|nr:MAG: hypothetical protein L6R42_003139 [Xanthoria sp. 1 TBL-2021]